MAHSSAESTARRLLDEALGRAAQIPSLPAGGWVRTMRRALGMTMRQMARRMERSPSAIVEIERNEVSGTLTLKRLRDAADALECDVRYVLVPRQGTVSQTLSHQAEKMAIGLVKRAHVHMKLENQALPGGRQRAQVAELAKELESEPRSLWDVAPE